MSGNGNKSELAEIKGLLVLLLLKLGATSEEVALATKSGASTVRRDFPAGRVRRFSTTESEGSGSRR
jgi:hypothetical protein